MMKVLAVTSFIVLFATVITIIEGSTPRSSTKTLSSTNIGSEISTLTSASVNTTTTSHQIPSENNIDIVVVFTILLKVVCILVLTSGIIGNLLVLVIFGCRCNRLKTFEVYMINLAVADLIGTMVFPSMQFHVLRGGSFHMIGPSGCKVIYFLTTLSITESALTLIVISVDRYLVVTRPYRDRVSNLSISLILALTWGVSSILGLTHFVGDRIILSNVGGGDAVVCGIQYKTPQDYKEVTVYILIIFAFQNGIPLIVMAVLYTLIIIKLRQTVQIQVNTARNTRTIRLLITIVVVFFVLVTPCNIFYMLYHFNVVHVPRNILYPIYTLLTMFLMMNSCINPVIYTRLHSSFRRTVLSILCYCCPRYRRANTHSPNVVGLTEIFRYDSDADESNENSRISLHELTEQTAVMGEEDVKNNF